MDRICKKSDQSPTVSILMPNLNNRPFLNERFATILGQTMTDWELIVIDSYSDDGAWEVIQAFAETDPRIRISQAPREGSYAALNRCLELACGDYIYIATSDDTMSPRCLEIMLDAMNRYSESEICHSCLKIIDEHGDEIPNSWRKFPAAEFYGRLLDTRHLRYAPYDGLLHCGVYMLYSSLTQLLIRRSVFEKIGVFKTDWGSVGDFEWNMRAALACNVLHLPVTLATWRRHSEQATQDAFVNSARHKAALCQMIKAALPVLKTDHPELYRKIRLHRLLFLYRQEQFHAKIGEYRNLGRKLLYVCFFMFISPRSVFEFMACRFFGKPRCLNSQDYIRGELSRLGLTQKRYVKILEA